GMADERLRVEQPGREELYDPPPGIAGSTEDALHAHVPEHDRVGVDPVRLSGDPFEDNRSPAPRELDRGPACLGSARCLEHEVETVLRPLISAYVPGFGRPQLETESEARCARPHERQAHRAHAAEERDREESD